MWTVEDARSAGRRRVRSAIEEVISRADVEAENHLQEQQQRQEAAAYNANDNNRSSVQRLESDSWCNIEATECIIRAVPICQEATTSPSPYYFSSGGGCEGGGGDDSCSIAFTAPTLASLSRSFGATFDSMDETNNNCSHSASSSHDDDFNDGNSNDNVVTAAPGGGDDVILEMDEEGGIESSIVATATVKPIFVDLGRYLYNSSNRNGHQQQQRHLETAISTDTVTTVTTVTTTATATETIAIHPCMARAEFVSATFIKKTAADIVGLTLTTGRIDGEDDETIVDTSGSVIRIAAIHKDGILYNKCPLRVGDQLLSISGQSCFELQHDTDKATAAQELLQQATGIVSVVARNPTGSMQYVETMVEKPSLNSPVGVAMRNTEYGSLMISNIVASGLFAHSLLNVGDRVISINNEYCPQGLSVQAAIDMIRDAPRFVCILTETQSRAGVVVPSAEVGLQGTVIPTDALGRPLSAAARGKHGRRLCSVIVVLILVIVVVDLLVFHPL